MDDRSSLLPLLLLILLVNFSTSAAVARYSDTGCDKPGVDELGGKCSASGAACGHSCVLFNGERLCIPERGEGEAGCGGDPKDGVCAPDLTCDNGTCRAAAWNEVCEQVRCAAGLRCVDVPGSKGGGFVDRCFRLAAAGEACTTNLNNDEETGKFVCEDTALVCQWDGTSGEEPRCLPRPSPLPPSRASRGESCAALPCYVSDWCDPADRVCKELPGDGERCATSPGTGGHICKWSPSLLCAADCFCRKLPGTGAACLADRGQDLCVDGHLCRGGVCLKSTGAGQVCGDGVHECGVAGVFCEEGICAEAAKRALFRKCGGDVEGGCRSGLICVQAQDGVQRCLRESHSDLEDVTCDTGKFDFRPQEIAAVGCRGGYECKADPSGVDYERKYCYTVVGALKGELCDRGRGGTSCVDNDGAGGIVSCEYYREGGESVQKCAGRAVDGGGCNGNSNDACLADKPSKENCDNGVCRIDARLACTADGGCVDPKRQCVEVNGRPTCVNYQRSIGEECARGAQPLAGETTWELKCKPEFTCFSRSLGRFDVSGVCSLIGAEGERCNQDEFLECESGVACVNGSCQGKSASL